MTRVKVCGITNVPDALAAVQAGVDAIGLIFAASKRRIRLETAGEITRALPPFVSCVGVFMDSHDADQIRKIASAARLDAIQLHGDESPEFCGGLRDLRVIKRARVTNDDTHQTLRAKLAALDAMAALLDPGAGNGQTFDWRIAHDLPGTLILSGGLTPANVAAAVRTVRPYAVDVATGVESAPGKKDPAKLRAFVQAVRKADDDHDD